MVDLPEPVGPVTRIRPWCRRARSPTTGGRPSSAGVGIRFGITRSATAVKPRWLNALPRTRARSRQLNEKSYSRLKSQFDACSCVSRPREGRRCRVPLSALMPRHRHQLALYPDLRGYADGEDQIGPARPPQHVKQPVHFGAHRRPLLHHASPRPIPLAPGRAPFSFLGARPELRDQLACSATVDGASQRVARGGRARGRHVGIGDCVIRRRRRALEVTAGHQSRDIVSRVTRCSERGRPRQQPGRSSRRPGKPRSHRGR